jgi:type II secretory pathway pseudopilin PulG
MQSGRLEDVSGFALVEALVAAAIVVSIATSVGLLIVRATREVWSAGAQSTAVSIAQQKLEQLSALEWRVDAAGNPRSDRTTDVSVDPPADTGTGLQPSPPGSLDRTTAGFADFVGADGRWRGGGTGPVPGAAYVRRWSIAPYGADPADSVILTVVVYPLADARGGDGRTSARLQTIRTRTAR